MSTSRNGIIPDDFSGFVRETQKRLSRSERRESPISAADLLGPGMGARAIELFDWNAEEATYNGFFYSDPGSLNSPDPTLAWAGTVVGKDDGAGMQQVWNTDDPTGTRYYIRTYVPNSLRDGTSIFDEWKKFATPTGLIELEDTGDSVQQPILDAAQNAQDALDAAAEAMGFVETQNKVFRQDEEPTDEPDRPLRAGDYWFDTDDQNRMRIYDGTEWVDPTEAIEAAFAADIAAATEKAQDALDAASAANTYAATRSRTYRQDERPDLAGSNVGDTWFDTNDSNRFRIYTGVDYVEPGMAPLLGTVIQTETAAQRGLKMASNGLFGYNTLGETTFALTSAGSLTLRGDLTVGSSVTGAIVTGGTLQTQSEANRGIKMNSAGMNIWDANGNARLAFSTASGSLILYGGLMSGGDVSGATVTGGVVQTTGTSQRGIKMSSSGGLVAYNSSGVATFIVDPSTGNLTLSGNIVSGGTFSGATLTGSQIETSANSTTGVKMTNAGITVYYANAPVFTVSAATGSATFKGTIQSGSTISGVDIEGSSLGTSNGRVSVTNNGFYAEAGSNSQFIYIYPNSGLTSINENRPVLAFGAGGAVSRIGLVGTALSITSDLGVWGSLSSDKLVVTALPTGDTTAGSAIRIFGDNRFFRVTSSRRYKTDITPLSIRSAHFDLEPKWYWRKDTNTPGLGFIAEEAEALGLSPWVIRNQDGLVDGFNYETWVVALQGMVRSLRDEITTMREEVATLKAGEVSVGIR